MDIYTIGHSTHDKERLVEMLQEYNIQLLVDIRSFAGSRRYPHFNKEVMPDWLKNKGIRYAHIPELGGRRRKLRVDVNNEGWTNISFKNYADYTVTHEFEEGLAKLLSLASMFKVAYMCSEHHPSRCHRTIVSDNLTAQGIDVYHILPYSTHQTKLAKHELGGWGAHPIVENHKVYYPSEQLRLEV